MSDDLNTPVVGFQTVKNKPKRRKRKTKLDYNELNEKRVKIESLSEFDFCYELKIQKTDRKSFISLFEELNFDKKQQYNIICQIQYIYSVIDKFLTNNEIDPDLTYELEFIKGIVNYINFTCPMCKSKCETLNRTIYCIQKHFRLNFYNCKVCNLDFHLYPHLVRHKTSENCSWVLKQPRFPKFFCSICNCEIKKTDVFTHYLEKHFYMMGLIFIIPQKFGSTFIKQWYAINFVN